MRSGPGLEGSGIPGKQEGAAAKLSKLKAQRQGQPGTARAAAVKGPPRQPAGGHGTGDGQSSLVTVLEEKDEIIKALRSPLTVAQQQAQQLTRVSAPAVPADGRQSGQPTAALEAQNAQLEGANLQLRQRLQESLAELHVAHEQLAVLQQLQHQLEEDVPGAAVLVDVALAQERALQESRNDRVLQMLKSKDEVIRNFEARYAEAQSEAINYKKQLDAALRDLDNSQVRVGELVEARATLRQQLEGQEAAAVEEQVTAKAELKQLQGEVAALRQRDAERCLLHDRIIAQQADLASAHGEVQKLSEAVEAANVVIQELQEVVHERDGQLEQADAQIEQLQQHVSRLLGVPHNEVPSLVASAHPQQESTVDMRVAELESANEQLEQALVHANKAGSASQGASESAEDHDDVTQLSIQLAEREGQLQAARQQVEELGAVHSLARETAIQAENRLKESLRQSAAFQQQCEALQQRLEQSEAVASQLTARVSELVLADQASRVALQEAEEALEKARHKSREMESLKQVELQAVRAAHAQVESHLQAAVAAAETKLAASQAEVAAVREELDIVKSQLAMQPLSQPGRVSSLGYQSFVSSMLEATAAVAAAGDPGLAVPHHEAAAMPHDKLLALVMALQLDLQALQGELAGARLEVAAAHQRALTANEKAFTQSQLQQLPLLDSIMQSLAGMRETSLASAENEGNAKAAELRQHHAEEMLLAAQAEAFKLKVLLQSQIQALHRQLAAAEEKVRQTEAANSAAQEACCAAQEAEAEKAAQLAVVMETLEVLQTGSAEGQQDHILAMTTELTAARGKEAALQQRCQALEAQLEAARLQVLALQHRLDAAAASMATADMLHAEEAAALQVTKDEMRDLRTRLVEQQGLVAKVHFEVGEARRAAAVSKSAAAGLQAALKQAQDRHHQQLARERGDAAAALRSAHLSHLQATLQRPGAAADTSLEELAAQVKLVCGKQGGDGATMAMKPLFSHLQKLLVRAQKAETNSSIVSAELQSTREQHRAVEAALEVRTSEWQAALAERELLQHHLAAAGALAGVYTARQLKLEHERNTGLCEQLSCCKVQLAQLEATLQKVEVECNKHKAEASELVAKLAVAEASSATPAGTEYLRNSASMTLGLTAEHETLLGMLQAAEQRADSFSELNFKLKGTLQDLQHRLASLATARPQATAAHLQGLERHTQQQTKRLAELEQDLQQREGEAVSQGKNGQRLQAEIVLLEARLKDAQQIAALAKQRAQEELADRNVQGCEAVTRQAEAVRIQAQQAAEQAQQQAHEQVRQAQQRVEELEAQLFEEQQAKDSLHSTLTQLEQQLSEACASLDAKAAALAMVTQTRPGAGRADSPSKQPGSGVAALSQRLLEASLQHVEAHKDLQIAQRLNKSLSKQLQVAERRTEQLKEALTAKAAVCNDLTKQVQQLHLQQSGPSTQSSFVCLPDLFSEEGKTNGVDLAPAAAGATAQSLSSTMQGGPWPSPTGSVSAVQLELAKREADIERLQTALGKAIDGQRGQAECFASLTKQAQHTEQELRTRLSSLENASLELAQLRAKCYAAAHEEQQEVIKKLQQYATAAATSQAGAQEKRDQLQDRLRLLRGSLGSGHAAEVQELIDMQEPAADVFGVLFESPGPPGSASSRPAPIAKPGRPQEDHTAGMFLLLRHHLKTLLRAQEQLASLLQQQQRSASQGHHSVVEDSAISGMLSKVAHAAAMLAAELPAMQATVQVMAVEITSLLRGQEPEGEL
ncbi:hypothetical protein N2152v2_001881 [Parachlorella kessleri]